MNKAFQTCLVVLRRSQYPRNRGVKDLRVGRCKVCQMIVLQMLPKLFHRVKLGSIGRQMLDGHSGEVAEQVADRIPFVHAAIVPNEDHPLAQVFQKFADEAGNAFVVDVPVWKCLEVETEPLVDRRKG